MQGFFIHLYNAYDYKDGIKKDQDFSDFAILVTMPTPSFVLTLSIMTSHICVLLCN